MRCDWSNYPPAKRIVCAGLGVLLGLSSVSVSLPTYAYAATSEASTEVSETDSSLDTIWFYSTDSEGNTGRVDYISG